MLEVIEMFTWLKCSTSLEIICDEKESPIEISHCDIPLSVTKEV